ncbi:MAG: DUF2111 domain-containing protein [Methanomicrobiales archaeon]|nr:DUF2111 domain-containing protein [Methanomicrobiales archaeon]
MARYVIAEEGTAQDLIPVLLCLHEIVHRLPVTGRTRGFPGARIEDGRVVDSAYTGPVLEQVLGENRLVRTTPKTGVYKGVPVVVAPIRDDRGAAIAALGVVDVTGLFDLATLMEHQSAILKQVCGKDPCPLPGEQIPARR